MNIGILYSHTYARDLYQWIPNYTYEVQWEFNNKGQYRITYIRKAFRSDGPWIKCQRCPCLVFDKDGKCLSYTPSKKAILAGALNRWYKFQINK